VRLTLRTLLAYLDDTLEPAEIKQIGQKVAESDAAQELVARIKQVTRRRRLTTPPATGPGARFDPNTVAEYLDNEMPGDQVAELEKQCLESDVHLAEIAACHQILTLVLGEPALVPPTAKERMYGLVQGREAIPFRKAASPQAAQAGLAGADADADEMLLLGLPFYRRSAWLRWALPLAAVLLLVGLGIALWQVVANTGPHDFSRVASADKGNQKDNAENTNGDAKPEPVKQPDPPPEPPTKPADVPVEQVTPPVKPVEPSRPPTTTKILPASKDRADVGFYHNDPNANAPPSILVQRASEGNEDWRRVTPGARVFSTDQLVSLPGYGSELRLDSGVRLLLRGHLREFSDPQQPLMNFLLESAAVLHKAPPAFDADLTLDRGRLFITNTKETGDKDKDKATVRLRFGKDDSEVWDVTLEEPGTEIGVDLIKAYTQDINYLDGEEPRAELYLVVLRGKASVRIDAYHHSNLKGPPGGAVFAWDNKGSGAHGPLLVEQIPPTWWSKVAPSTPVAKPMTIALQELSRRMVGKTSPSVVLEEMRQAEEAKEANRKLAIYCYCGLDEVRRLIDALGDEDPMHVTERDTAVFTLRRWLANDAAHTPLLYDVKKKTGLLLKTQKYRPQEAENILQLLHNFSEEARKSAETYEYLAYCLTHEKVAIAHLAWWHLMNMGLAGVKLPPFNAALPKEAREMAANEVRKLIRDGKLPPAAPSAPPGPGAPPMPPKQP
jgi:hypothetical protein